MTKWINPTRSLRESDLVVFGTDRISEDDIEGVEAEQLKTIPRLILPDRKFDRSSFSRLRSKLGIPWQIQGLVRLQNKSFPNFTEKSWFETPSTENEDLIRRLPVQAYYRVKSPTDENVIVDLEGEPLFVRSRNWYLLTTPPNQFMRPQQAGVEWPSLMLNIVRQIVREQPPEPWFAGEPAPLPSTLDYPVTIHKPDNSVITLERNNRWKPPSPGFYRLSGKSGSQIVRAVNYNPREGNLSRLPPDRWPDWIKPYSSRQGYHLSLSPWLWILLMGCIGLDVWWDNESTK